MRRHPTATVNVVRISVATSGLISPRPRRSSPRPFGLPASAAGDHICHVGLQELGQRQVSSRRETDQSARSDDVRRSGWSGSRGQPVKTAHPKRTLAAPVGVEPEVGLTHQVLAITLG
jgi:hypothetical protein